MSDKTHSSAPITRREVTSVLGNGRKPLASIAKAQALLKERAAAAADGYFVPAANVTPLNSNPLNARPQAGESESYPFPAFEIAPGGSHLIVGANVKLKCAEILDCETLIIEGEVEASMNSQSLSIAPGGALRGKVNVEVAEIHGRFDGELHARSQLIIHATGRVSGKVRYGQLFVGQGGELRGDTDTAGDPPVAAKGGEDGAQRPPLKAVAGDERRIA